MAKLTLKQRFTYQAPTPEQLPKYEAIRKAAFRLARIIEKNTPHDADSNSALKLIELAVMSANKSIALEKFKRD